MEQIRDNFDILKIKKNQVIYSEGSTPLGVFYLQSGEVLISKLASQGRDHILRVISKEGIFCCADLLLNRKYSSSSRAIKDSTVLFLPKSEFLRLVHEDESFNNRVITQLAQEVVSLENKLTSLAYKPLRGRLADNLLSLDNDNNDSGIAICLSRIELAGFTGTVKETVNRILSEFQKDKIISMSHREIQILDRDRLLKVSKQYD